MIIKVSNRHINRINIERMIERINKSIVTINHSVDTLEREDDSKKHMKNACEYAKEIDTKIKEQKKILHRYQNERSTYIARLNNCGIFDRHLKKEIPEQAIYLARYGQAAWNKKYATYIPRDYLNIKLALRKSLTNYLNKKLKRRPMIVPIIIETND